MNSKCGIGLAAALGLLGAITSGVGQAALQGNPTCSDTLGIDVHGQHVVGDYVTGIGHDELDWPPRGRIVGETVAANGGAILPGGPGPSFHLEHGVAPGASFCTDSRSPGAHL